MNFVRSFENELNRPLPAPERLALSIAGLAHPDLSVEEQVARLDRMADDLQPRLQNISVSRHYAEIMMHYLYDELGIRGDKENYFDPGNSYLNDVLDRRRGLPILLSLICMAVGRRLGVSVQGMGFPGHFMARLWQENGGWILDLFHGRVMAESEVADHLSGIFEQPMQLPPQTFRPVSSPALAQRILNNLHHIYLQRRNHAMTIAVLDYMLVLTPSRAAIWQERGLLHYQLSDWEAASRDLRRYYFLTGQLMHIMGVEEGAELDDGGEDNLLDIFRQVEDLRDRIN